MKAKEIVRQNQGKTEEAAPDVLKTIVDEVLTKVTGKSPAQDVNALRDGQSRWLAICAGLGWQTSRDSYLKAMEAQAPVAYAEWVKAQKTVADNLREQTQRKPLTGEQLKKQREHQFREALPRSEFKPQHSKLRDHKPATARIGDVARMSTLDE